MILITINPESITGIVDHLASVYRRILVGIRLGLRDGLRGLAAAEVEAASSHRRTGLLERILGQPGRIIETDDSIVAIYRPRFSGKQPHYWLEYGAHIPEVSDTVLAMQIEGETMVRRGHQAFDVPAHPFFFATGEAYRGALLASIQARVAEAMRA
jgi:hypothetical protein